ncbi:hydantoinase/oxoprolinase family protein [Bradyrhizobium sp.]|uniref:hydantoinase/oxoprolinase family protein n=1 Tax=Bradyrhizobium sp. TaxID=376 RepID=UPI003C34E4BE
MDLVAVSFRIGVDIGGTFTDVSIVDSAGRVHASKSLSLPADPAQGVIKALHQAAGQLGTTLPYLLSHTSLFVHGSTIATNTLLERTGAVVGLLGTEGFRDTIEIRRGWRDNPWDHRTPWPDPVVPRHRRLSVIERIDVDGNPVVPLDAASVLRALERLLAFGVESVAVCLLHSYRNPEHENRCRDIIARHAPHVWLTLSSELAPIAGEYERASTAVINAYVAPRVVPYLEGLEQQLRAFGLRKLLVVQSNGGVASVPQIARRPAAMLLSGPAAAAGALAHYQHDADNHDLISLEVGGTSCDVMMMRDGEIGMTDLLDIDRLRAAVPSVEIMTVSAGGGSIATVDEGGLLSVGPRGAGSHPGPVCYERGGVQPTVTDAQLLLGRLRPGAYGGGAIALNRWLAEEAIRKHVAEPLRLQPVEAAAGIIRLAEQTMLHAVENVSIEKGLDPRRFTLVAGGGAGALHAASIARLAGCQNVFVPRLAGILCAFGMCNTDIRYDLQRSVPIALEQQHGPYLTQIGDALIGEAAAMLEGEGFGPDGRRFVTQWNIRYAGQQSAIPVAVDRGEPVAVIGQRFEAEHQRLFGHTQPDGQHQVVSIKVSGFGALDRGPTRYHATRTARVGKPDDRREIWVDPDRDWREVPVFIGASLAPRVLIDGPAIVEEATTTILVGARDRLRVTMAGNYIIELQ